MKSIVYCPMYWYNFHQNGRRGGNVTIHGNRNTNDFFPYVFGTSTSQDL